MPSEVAVGERVPEPGGGTRRRVCVENRATVLANGKDRDDSSHKGCGRLPLLSGVRIQRSCDTSCHKGDGGDQLRLTRVEDLHPDSSGAGLCSGVVAHCRRIHLPTYNASQAILFSARSAQHSAQPNYRMKRIHHLYQFIPTRLRPGIR